MPGRSSPSTIRSASAVPASCGASVRNSSSTSPSASSARLSVGPPSHSRARTPRARRVGERGGRRQLGQPDELQRRGDGGRLGRVRAGEHDHRLVGGGEQPGVPRQVERARDQHGGRGLGPPCGHPPGDPPRIADQPPVALGAQRPGADQDRVGERPQLGQQQRVGVRAERPRAAADRRPPVDRRDHVQVDERPVGRRAVGRPQLREPLVRRARARGVEPLEPGHRAQQPSRWSLTRPQACISA